jgi:hypothetical protein
MAVMMDLAVCNEAGGVIAVIEVNEPHFIGTRASDAQGHTSELCPYRRNDQTRHSRTITSGSRGREKGSAP